MGRTFTLRGTYTVDDNALGTQTKLLDYQSPDRRKAWKVKSAYMFPKDTRAEIGANDLQGTLSAILWTDLVNRGNGSKDFNDLVNVEDNRQCAWLQRQYLLRAGGTDFICANGAGMGAFLVDPDTVVTKELYIEACFTTESSTNPSRTWNYIVELEEIKISSSESILQQLKGIGQDIDDDLA